MCANEIRLAVLMTCYNRKRITLRCLNALFAQELPDEVTLDVFLVDDGSPDGTGDAVKAQYPSVEVLKGTGNLYWGGGMRLAWATAAAHADYDFYIWLNDDVVLEPFGIQILFKDYKYVLENEGEEALLSGCVKCPQTGETTYSGNNGRDVVDPNGFAQPVLHNNGNIVLIPRKIFKTEGNISKEFQHQLGDGEYGLRCRVSGFGCYVSSCYIGSCEQNDRESWRDPMVPLFKRLRLLHMPTGMPPRDTFRFYYKHGGLTKAVLSVLKLYARVFFPVSYQKLIKEYFS